MCPILKMLSFAFAAALLGPLLKPQRACALVFCKRSPPASLYTALFSGANVCFHKKKAGKF